MALCVWKRYRPTNSPALLVAVSHLALFVKSIQSWSSRNRPAWLGARRMTALPRLLPFLLLFLGRYPTQPFLCLRWILLSLRHMEMNSRIDNKISLNNLFPLLLLHDRQLAGCDQPGSSINYRDLAHKMWLYVTWKSHLLFSSYNFSQPSTLTRADPQIPCWNLRESRILGLLVV